MLIRRNLLAVHGEPGHPVAHAQIPEDLIIGPVFLNDVDHMPDGVGPAAKRDLRLRGLHHIRLYHGARHLLAPGFDLRQVDGRNRAMQQGGDVRGAAAALIPRDQPLRHIIWPRALALGGRHVERIAFHRHRRRIPLRRNPTHGPDRRPRCLPCTEIKDGNRIGARVGSKEPLAIL